MAGLLTKLPSVTQSQHPVTLVQDPDTIWLRFWARSDSFHAWHCKRTDKHGKYHARFDHSILFINLGIILLRTLVSFPSGPGKRDSLICELDSIHEPSLPNRRFQIVIWNRKLDGFCLSKILSVQTSVRVHYGTGLMDFGTQNNIKNIISDLETSVPRLTVWTSPSLPPHLNPGSFPIVSCSSSR